MTVLHVFKAQPVAPIDVIDDLRIELDRTIPEQPDLRTSAAVYDKDGQAIADALIKYLPGGTLDATLRHLLEFRASLLRVPA